jgi:hypothetical protein
MGLLGGGLKSTKSTDTRPSENTRAEATAKPDLPRTGSSDRKDLRDGRPEDGTKAKSSSPKANDTTSSPKANLERPKPTEPKPSPPQPPADHRREIYVEFAEAEREAEEEALKLHPKPKGPGANIVDAIKADNARQAYVFKRLKAVKQDLVEQYRISLKDLEDLIREGKAQGWPRTRPK